jgi:hypothetical protein
MAQLGVPWENLRWPVDLGSVHQESGWAAANSSVLWCPALLGFFLDVLPRTEQHNGVLRCFWRCFELFLFLNMPGCPRISLKNVRDHISPEDWRRPHCPSQFGETRFSSQPVGSGYAAESSPSPQRRRKVFLTPLGGFHGVHWELGGSMAKAMRMLDEDGIWSLGSLEWWDLLRMSSTECYYVFFF